MPTLRDIAANAAEPAEAVRILRTWGVVLLRRAVALAVIDTVRERLLADFSRLPEMMRQNQGTEQVLGELGLIAPGLTPHYPELLRLSRLAVEASLLQPILAGYFGAPPVPALDHLRFRRQPAAARRQHVPLHQDILFYGTDTSIVNCWVPLTPCGTEAPGLRIFPMPAVARFVHRGKGGDEAYPMAFIQEQALDQYRQRFPLAALAPDLQPGDVLLFDAWCLHQTTQDPGMTRERLSFEARYTFSGSEGPARDGLRFDAAAAG